MLWRRLLRVHATRARKKDHGPQPCHHERESEHLDSLRFQRDVTRSLRVLCHRLDRIDKKIAAA
jgi:diadenosine tetraphosphatase ApaH/serine/threonine PP2A family protein phosphatase